MSRLIYRFFAVSKKQIFLTLITATIPFLMGILFYLSLLYGNIKKLDIDVSPLYDTIAGSLIALSASAPIISDAVSRFITSEKDSGFSKYLSATPIPAKEEIGSVYLSAILFNLLSNFVTLVQVFIYIGMGILPFSLQSFIPLLAISFLGIIYTLINIPLLFTNFGGNATIISTFVTMFFFGIFSLIIGGNGADMGEILNIAVRILTISPPLSITLIVIFCLIIILISYKLTIFIKRKRDYYI